MSETHNQPGGTSQRERRPAPPLTCGGCDNIWTGTGRAHCSACHSTFSSVSTFDQHRIPYGPRGSCVKPELVTTRDGARRLFLRDGIWCGPEMTEEAKAKAFGGSAA